MGMDPWLPFGFRVGQGDSSQSLELAGANWQIIRLKSKDRCLLVKRDLLSKWQDDGLVEDGIFFELENTSHEIWYALSSWDRTLCSVQDGKVVKSKSVAAAFAVALKETRQLGSQFGFQDAIYFERISRLLPTYTVSERASDEDVLGRWLTGGVHISASAVRRMDQAMAWLNEREIRQVLAYAGIAPSEVLPGTSPSDIELTTNEVVASEAAISSDVTRARLDTFELPGRPQLAAFFNEHVIDIVRNQERYRAVGIDFPSAMILHGPPGCGKTFAVHKLIDFLGWPSFEIDASSVASPYIHETSKKVAQVFTAAIEKSPSVLVIDEMEAFLADRDMGSGHHRVEEVAEFLRRIPEAIENNVLIIAMTNRIDLIDPAIQRRGRFDHIIEVDFANAEEITSLLKNLLKSLPTADDVNVELLADELSGRPLSDVSFVVREAARLTAREALPLIDHAMLMSALRVVPARDREGGKRKHKIGFI
ncbi:ATP-binding protein [Rhodobacteraceae bacterium HSP-20]|uniref:ATP-binding protein n=1 Tax=Paragemmobacter amnigenus TaxID=2852097 RepID=A0ABS6J8F5_9RHOB|nr:ATP-binding protein [Rhodobacter amnigenus]MBU9700025.1 ATP-binding protein [Rhodobacter amnigenus]MBV4391252.1 ATP-binding protein [Rhodobacter amnigenus]